MGRNLYPSLPGFTIISISLKALGLTSPAHPAELYVNADADAVHPLIIHGGADEFGVNFLVFSSVYHFL